MTRASKAPPHRAPGPRSAPTPAAPPDALDPAAWVGTGFDPGWAREALGTTLCQGRSLMQWIEAVQEAQERAWHDAAHDAEAALREFEHAQGASALAAVPSHWASSHWQHSLENASQTAGRLLEIEAAWLRDAQTKTAQRSAAGPNGAPCDAEPAAVRGSGEEAQGTPPWQQWYEDWQRGVGELSRTWSEAVQQPQRN